MWFVLALAGWRMLAPLLGAVRWPVALTLAVALATSAAGTLPSGFTIGRIVMLLPFFAAGLALAAGSLERVPSRIWRMGAGSVLVAAVPFAWLVAARLDRDYILWNGRANRDGWDDLLIQSSLYLVATAMVAAVLVLVPRRRFRWTLRGERSMYVYLLHIPVLIALRAWLENSGAPASLLFCTALAASLLITVVLSSHLVQRLTRPLVQPRVGWLLARPAVSGSGSLRQ
jgi:fucose 4-O-acetylase-like acetyltransferase